MNLSWKIAPFVDPERWVFLCRLQVLSIFLSAQYAMLYSRSSQSWFQGFEFTASFDRRRIARVLNRPQSTHPKPLDILNHKNESVRRWSLPICSKVWHSYIGRLSAYPWDMEVEGPWQRPQPTFSSKLTVHIGIRCQASITSLATVTCVALASNTLQSSERLD